jgi:single-stranded-DNA-specific exonuclease
MDTLLPARRESRTRPASKVWQLLPHYPTEIAQLSASLGLPPILLQVLYNRGLTQADGVERFLSTPLKGLHDPELLAGVREATEVIHRAARDGKRICVYGDYDVDGLTGTAILWQTLKMLGTHAHFYVPHRLEEGYGLNPEALARLAADGTSLVVTVDCGIASLAEADEARRLGLSLIITDHHEFKDRLPAASAIIHPRLPGNTYPFGQLSGSGVAFKLAWSLCRAQSGNTRVTPAFREFLIDSVGLAALGMVADWVPLLDENRIIVQHGLRRLPQSPSVGLKALLDAAGLSRKAVLAAADVSFGLAPRLNAAGRLGCARMVVELLTTQSASRALELTRFLEGQNAQRQQIERRIQLEAQQMLDEHDLESMPAFVLAGRDWHAGVIGIVAGRLAEQYARPVLLIALRDGVQVVPGSGRSVADFPLHIALQECGEELISHGGHAAAAGFRMAPERLDSLRQRFYECARRHFQDGRPSPRLLIDAEIPLSALGLSVVEQLARLEPFGAANRRPVFLAGPVHLAGEPRKVGKGERHLQFRVRQEEAVFPVIAFNCSDRVEELMSAAGECCIAFSPSVNEWQGFRSVQLELLDFQPGPRARLA